MTARSSQDNRAHNLRIVGTISNDTDLKLDWQPVESELLAAVAYVDPQKNPLPALPERRSLSLLHLSCRSIPGLSRRRVERPLLPQPHSQSLPLSKTPAPLKDFLGQIKTVLAGRLL